MTLAQIIELNSETPRCLLTEVKNQAHLTCLLWYNKQATCVEEVLQQAEVVACCRELCANNLNLLSWKTCFLIYHSPFAQQLITNQSTGWGCVVFSPFTRGRIIATYECVFGVQMLVVWTVPSQFNPGNDVGLPCSFSVCQSRICRILTLNMLSQAALCSVTCPHYHYTLCVFFAVKVSGESSSWKGRIHHIMPTAADSGRGLGVFNPPPLQCVAVRKRGSYWSPLPLSSSPDFSALNGVLHYACCSPWSSPVQGLNCMHRGWHCTVRYTSDCRLRSACSFCRVRLVGICHFCSSFTNDPQ